MNAHRTYDHLGFSKNYLSVYKMIHIYTNHNAIKTLTIMIKILMHG